VVEIGCGSRQYRGCFAGRYLGIDLAEHYGSRADVEADAHFLPLAAASADLVFMVATLLYLRDMSAVLGEVQRVLRPEGMLAVFDYSWWRARPGRVNYFTSFSLARRLRSVGFVSRVHWTCAPTWGGTWLRSASRSPAARLAAYLPGNWVIVSGTKRG
jgi:SAM-dependent methyltransferase